MSAGLTLVDLQDGATSFDRAGVIASGRVAGEVGLELGELVWAYRGEDTRPRQLDLGYATLVRGDRDLSKIRVPLRLELVQAATCPSRA
jgi:hypothetical protein